MNRIFPLLLLSATLLATGCSPVYQTAFADYDKSVDFRKYKTFAWLRDSVDTANNAYNNEIIRNNIRNYFGVCFSDRGMSFNAEAPDVLVQLTVVNAKKEKVYYDHQPSTLYRPYYYGSYYYSPYPFGYYYHGGAFGGYGGYYRYNYGTAPKRQTIDYMRGAITLNVIDREAQKPVWTATAEGDIYDPSVIEKDLHPAVHSLIGEYPLKALVKRGHKFR